MESGAGLVCPSCHRRFPYSRAAAELRCPNCRETLRHVSGAVPVAPWRRAVRSWRRRFFAALDRLESAMVAELAIALLGCLFSGVMWLTFRHEPPPLDLISYVSLMALGSVLALGAWIRWGRWPCMAVVALFAAVFSSQVVFGSFEERIETVAGPVTVVYSRWTMLPVSGRLAWRRYKMSGYGPVTAAGLPHGRWFCEIDGRKSSFWFLNGEPVLEQEFYSGAR